MLTRNLFRFIKVWHLLHARAPTHTHIHTYAHTHTKQTRTQFVYPVHLSFHRSISMFYINLLERTSMFIMMVLQIMDRSRN